VLSPTSEMMPSYPGATQLKLETGNELEAFVRIAASGSERPKCLLIHGNPGSIKDWEPLIPRLCSAADIAAIDMPGFGRTRRIGPTAESMSLDRLAQQAIFVANVLDWRQPFFLVGHSHGGAVAQVAAAHYPERIAGLTLIGSVGASAHAGYRFLSLPGAAAIARFMGFIVRSKRLRPLSRAILGRVLNDIFSPERAPPERLEYELDLLSSRPEILESMVHVTLGRPCAQLLRSAAQIRCPIHFIHGGKDAVVPANRARSIHELVLKAGGRSQFQLIPDAGHMLTHARASDFADIIVRNLLSEARA